MNQDLAQELSNENGELRGEYSGRGMMGETTFGVVFEQMEDFYTAMANIIEYGTKDLKEELVEMLRQGFRTDSMGYGVIIY